MFKVGDKVITSLGEVGVITSICDCDRCKERGFFEPQVKTELGAGHIWITNTDKENGFRSFYQIGDYTFGNIDEESVLTSIKNTKERIAEEVEHLSNLEKQLDSIKSVKKESWWFRDWR